MATVDARQISARLAVHATVRHMTTEDERLGLLLRAIRRRTNQTQAALAETADIPRRDVMRIEAGQAGEVQLDRVRRAFEAVDGRLRTVAWWHGAAADRLLDERHAAIGERVVAVLAHRGWLRAMEVTFSEWGERGSIDILAAHPTTRAALVGEIKGSLGSLEETNRTLDAKVRLAPKLVLQRFGWLPSSVSRVLILPRDSTVRRIVEGHSATMDSLYPARSREIRAWLRNPEGAISGIWFVSEVRDRDVG
jgi:DNA-binding XRE family transcriptional regulator